MLTTILFLFNIIMGYLIGSISSAVIVCRVFGLPNPQLEGSHNPGATNVLRLAGKKYALIVLLADMLKGFLAVLLAKFLGAGEFIISFTCLATVLGHVYPIFFKFKGGKGVATALGALLGFNYILGLMVIATWLIIAKISHFSSLASIISLMVAPFYFLFLMNQTNGFIPLLFIGFLVLYNHRDNVTRLIQGQEPKISFRK